MRSSFFSSHTLVSDAFYPTIGSITYSFCLWVITVLVVRLSGYEDAGILSVAMTSTNAFFVVANYGMRSFQASDIVPEYTNSQYVLSRYLTVTAGILLCAVFTFLFGYRGLHAQAILVFMLYKSVEAFADVLFGVMQRGQQLRKTGLSMIFKGILSVVGFVAGYLLTGQLLWSLVIMLILSFLILLGYDVPVTQAVDSSALVCRSRDLVPCRNLLNVCFAMFLVNLSPMLLQAVPKLIFERLCSTEEMGIYSSVAAPVVILPTMIACILVPFYPLLAEAIQAHDYPRLRRTLFRFTSAILGLGALACLAAWIFGGWALSFLFGSDMHRYTGLLIWVLCSVILTSLLNCLNALFISGRKLKLLAGIYLTSTALAYLIAEPLIRLRGIYGITDTLNITQLLLCLTLWLFAIPCFLVKSTRHQ